jgi:hypothetical protein
LENILVFCEQLYRNIDDWFDEYIRLGPYSRVSLLLAAVNLSLEIPHFIFPLV